MAQKNCGCGQDPCVTFGAESYFEAPQTMTPLQAKKRFLALMKPYWLKDLKESRGPKLSRKQYIAERGDDDYYDAYLEDWEWWNDHVKTVQSGAYGPASPSGDTMLRESLPFTYYDFIDNIAGAIPEELDEKYSYDNGFEVGHLSDDETHACILDGEPSWEDYSTADKRKINALEKRYDSDKIDSDEYYDTWDKITKKYSTQKFHRNKASRLNCRYCGPVIKAMNNMNNWNWKFLEYDDFWNECKKEKIPVRELKSLTNIILGKAKPKPKPKAKAKAKATTRKAKPKASKPKAKAGRKAPTISATKRKIGTRMRGNDGKMWEVKKSGKSQRWMAGAETFGAEMDNDGNYISCPKCGYEPPVYEVGEEMEDGSIIETEQEAHEETIFWLYENHPDYCPAGWNPDDDETFEAPKTNKGFVWEYYDYGDDPRTKAAQESYGKYAGRFTIGPAVKKAQKDGWKRVNSKYGPRIWSRMAKTPQWKPWVKDLTARSKYERHAMGETIDVLNGTARWKKSGDYSPDHMGEDGDWEILTKDNKIMLLYYYANDELSTRLMRKTFTSASAPVSKRAETNESSLPYPQPTITDIVSYDFKTYITLRYPDTPEYYGYETVVEYNPDSQYQAEGFTDTLEEAAPAKGVLVAPAIAAIVGVLGGLRAAGFKFKRN